MLYDDKKFVGSVIKNARKKANLTQALLSEKVNLAEKSINSIENGKRFPTANNFLRIIEVLNIPLEEFGVKLGNTNDNSKIKLIEKILNADTSDCYKYLKIINCIDDIIK